LSTQVREHPVLDVRRARRARRVTVSPTEVLAALAAAAAIVVVLVYYFSSLKPEQARAAEAENRLQQQEKTLIEHRMSDKANAEGAGETSGLAKDSLAQFKEKWLKPLGQGRIALIDDINALTKKTGVQLISGIDMQSGAESESSSEKRERQKKIEDVLNVYPKLEIQFSVFGPYQSLRNFVRELEENKQFLVIQQISLTSIEEAKGGPRVGRGGVGGSGVALSINATCYFRP